MEKFRGCCHAPPRLPPRLWGRGTTPTYGYDEIGKHAGFRFQCREACGFESHYPYQSIQKRDIHRDVPFVLSKAKALWHAAPLGRRPSIPGVCTPLIPPRAEFLS